MLELFILNKVFVVIYFDLSVFLKILKFDVYNLVCLRCFLSLNIFNDI